MCVRNCAAAAATARPLCSKAAAKAGSLFIAPRLLASRRRVRLVGWIFLFDSRKKQSRTHTLVCLNRGLCFLALIFHAV